MGKNHLTGSEGEKDVIEKVKCPNCTNRLMRLPPSFPLSDVLCTACVFRAQVKTSTSKPGDKIMRATWKVMEYQLKAGHLIPPLIVNYNWNGQQEIRFYPFISKENLKTRTISPTAVRANLMMFDYVGLNKLPFILLYRSEVSISIENHNVLK
jgi:hypothetical protein